MAIYIEERTARRRRCPTCGQRFEHVTGFVKDPVLGAVAAYFAACHGEPEHTAQIDVILGPWGDGTVAAGRAHFSCVLRSDGAMAVDAPVSIEADTPALGTRLSRDEALAHELVPRFWQVVDLLASTDPSVRAAVYGGDGAETEDSRPRLD